MGEKKEKEPRLLIDVCLTAALPEYLLHHLGIDAIRVDNALPMNAADKDIVALAREQDRMIVTENAEDFRRLAENSPGHPGLIVIAASVGKANQLHLVRIAVEKILADVEKGRTYKGRVYDVAADGRIRRHKLPK